MIAVMETAFDTLAYTRRLKDAGVAGTHAEAHADTLRAAFHDGVATKADLAHLETRIEARFAALETRLTVRLFGGLIALGGSIIAVVKFL